MSGQNALATGVADANLPLTIAGVPLGVLDLAPVPDGSTAGDALRATIDLAKKTEDLGFTRFWVAEHHGMPGVASSSPPVLIGHIADATRTIRVGSGGVMLPNHSSLVVAEQFGMLEALHPGRIDLGIGRAPGTDQATAQALRHRVSEDRGPDDFPRQLTDLLGFFTGQWPENHPYQKVHAIPGEGDGPDLWLLGSSGYSAQVAGALGIPFAFAHHFMPQNTLPALDLYRKSFRPSAELEKPYSMIAAGVICADTDEHAKFLAGASALSFLKLRTGRPGQGAHAGGGGRLPVLRPGEGVHRGPPVHPVHRRTGHGDRGPDEPGQANRRRRADAHHPDPQPRRPPQVLQPGGGCRPRPLAFWRPLAEPVSAGTTTANNPAG
jgi:luciferase family oxidoreductase group 1